MSYEPIALLMFASMMLMLMTGQRVFGAIGAVAVIAAMSLWGDGGVELGFAPAMKLIKCHPPPTPPLFIYMGYMLSESGIADDLYRIFHVWSGDLRSGLAVGAIGLMVVISAMNGLSVAGKAIGASVAPPELLRRGYDRIMVTGVIQAGGSLGILAPPSVAPVSIPYEEAEVAAQTGALDGMVCSGIAEDYTVGWATVTDYITTNACGPRRFRTLHRKTSHHARRHHA